MRGVFEDDEFLTGRSKFVEIITRRFEDRLQIMTALQKKTGSRSSTAVFVRSSSSKGFSSNPIEYASPRT